MQACKTCRHWVSPHPWRNGFTRWAGMCSLPGTQNENVSDDFVVATEGTDYGDLLTGADFGCVKHEPAIETVQEDDGA